MANDDQKREIARKNDEIMQAMLAFIEAAKKLIALGADKQTLEEMVQQAFDE
jgi:hypothetical protein